MRRGVPFGSGPLQGWHVVPGERAQRERTWRGVLARLIYLSHVGDRRAVAEILQRWGDDLVAALRDLRDELAPAPAPGRDSYGAQTYGAPAESLALEAPPSDPIPAEAWAGLDALRDLPPGGEEPPADRAADRGRLQPPEGLDPDQLRRWRLAAAMRAAKPRPKVYHSDARIGCELCARPIARGALSVPKRSGSDKHMHADCRDAVLADPTQPLPGALCAEESS